MENFENRLDGAAKSLGLLATEVPTSHAQSVESVVQFLVDHLVVNELIPPEKARVVADTVMKRERLGSTAVGRGLAIPHANVVCVNELIGVLARSRIAPPWESLDSQPVHRICLLLAPVSKPADLSYAIQSLNDALRPSGH